MYFREKQAWFELSTGILGGSLFLTLVAMSERYPASWVAIFSSLMILLTFHIGQNKLKNGKAFTDERDKQISIMATLIGLAAYGFSFMAAALTPYVVLGSKATLSISTRALADTAWGGMYIFAIAHSVAVIVLYRKGKLANPSEDSASIMTR